MTYQTKTNNQKLKKMEKQIYLVIEIGTGIIHRAFESKSEALKYIEYLKIETDMDCYELHSVEFQIQSNL